MITLSKKKNRLDTPNKLKKLYQTWQIFNNKVNYNLASFELRIYFSSFQQLKFTSNTKTYKTLKKILSMRTGNFLSMLSHNKGVLNKLPLHNYVLLLYFSSVLIS